MENKNIKDEDTKMSGKYTLTVGLEVHAELNTVTKMFCRCKNDPDEKRPNVNVCPVCMGHPGTLPFANKQAVKNVLLMGVAVGANLADFSEFDRKNYFYPDIPKGYQISQYKYPFVYGGELAGVALTRVHLEEDTAKSSHESGSGGGVGYSLVDFNRAGLPLLELVTDPVIHSAKEAGDFARELQLLFRTLGIAEANMEKGEMRVEANISVLKTLDIVEDDHQTNQKNQKKFGTKVEVKNLNSFRSVERAIEYEMNRHIEMLENGEEIIQETRGWDEAGQKTYSQRVKENSNDYRYFPDPDLLKMKLSEVPEFSREVLLKELPELPWEKRKRYSEVYKLSPQHVEYFVSESSRAEYFDKIANLLAPDEILIAANYVSVDLAGLSEKEGFSGNPSPEHIAELVKMINGGEISSRAAKDILTLITMGLIVNVGDVTSPKSPRQIAEEQGLFQKSDESSIEAILRPIIDANPQVVVDYKSGKESAIMFFVGQGMKASKGSANPEILKKVALKMIS